MNSPSFQVFKGLLEPIISPETMKRHPVSELYEVCQKNNKKVEFVDLWAKNTAFNVFIDGQLVGTASYGLKKEVAHNRAAKNALDNIGLILGNQKESTIIVQDQPDSTIELTCLIDNNLKI